MKKIVYNRVEIKNGVTKERRAVLRHDVVYVVFCFGFERHYLTFEKVRRSMELSMFHHFSILFK